MASTLPVWKIRKANTRSLFHTTRSLCGGSEGFSEWLGKIEPSVWNHHLPLGGHWSKSVVPNCGYIQATGDGVSQTSCSPALQAAWEMLIGGGGGGRVLLLTCRDLEWECLKQSWEVKTIGFQLLLLSVCGSLFIVGLFVGNPFANLRNLLLSPPVPQFHCQERREHKCKWMSSANSVDLWTFFFFKGQVCAWIF